MSYVYDAGILVGAARNDAKVWADHLARLEEDVLPVTTAPVIAQVCRSGRQANLRRFLETCEIVGFEPDQAHDVGRLLRQAGSSDVVGAHVVYVAHSRGGDVVTGDGDDLQRLAECLSPPVEILPL